MRTLEICGLVVLLAVSALGTHEAKRHPDKEKHHADKEASKPTVNKANPEDKKIKMYKREVASAKSVLEHKFETFKKNVTFGVEQYKKNLTDYFIALETKHAEKVCTNTSVWQPMKDTELVALNKLRDKCLGLITNGKGFVDEHKSELTKLEKEMDPILKQWTSCVRFNNCHHDMLESFSTNLDPILDQIHKVKDNILTDFQNLQKRGWLCSYHAWIVAIYNIFFLSCDANCPRGFHEVS